jgi:D-aspartate ligase
MEITDNSVPVVVLVSSQHGGLGIIRSLSRAGVRVWGVHESAWEPAARSRFLQGVFCWDFSSASARDSVTFLLQIAQTIRKRPILIPTSDVTALFLAENAEPLADAYLFSTASAEVVRSFSSKKQTCDLCRELGIPTAETALPQSRNEVLSFAQTKQFPVIVKGEGGEFLRNTGESARVAIVSQESQLLEIFDLNAKTGPPKIILQEYIPGGDDTIWMFNGYFNERSECLFGATGRKLRQFPAHRGSTSLGVCQKNEVVQSQTLQLMKAVGYRGPLDVGYRFDARDGQYKLLDVNPRIGATFRLFAAENGLDVSRALYLHLTGQPVPPAQVCQGRKWIVESNDLVSSFACWRERLLTLGGWLRSLRGIQEGVWLAWDDPAPLAMLPFLWWRKQSRRRSQAASAKAVNGVPA